MTVSGLPPNKPAQTKQSYMYLPTSHFVKEQTSHLMPCRWATGALAWVARYADDRRCPSFFPTCDLLSAPCAFPASSSHCDLRFFASGMDSGCHGSDAVALASSCSGPFSFFFKPLALVSSGDLSRHRRPSSSLHYQPVALVSCCLAVLDYALASAFRSPHSSARRCDFSVLGSVSGRCAAASPRASWGPVPASLRRRFPAEPSLRRRPANCGPDAPSSASAGDPCAFAASACLRCGSSRESLSSQRPAASRSPPPGLRLAAAPRSPLWIPCHHSTVRSANLCLAPLSWTILALDPLALGKRPLLRRTRG